MTLNLKPVELDKLSAKTQAGIVWEDRIVMPKWDGCFTIVLFDDNMVCSNILSREGTTIYSCDHFADYVLDHGSFQPWLRESHQQDLRVAVLGEAWAWATPFKDISGAYRRHSAQPQLQLRAFDTVYWRGDFSAPELYSDEPYLQRLGRCPDYPIYVRGGLSYSQTQELAKLYKYGMTGRDGAISADPNATYKPGSGRAGEFIKFKPLASKALEVVGIEAAKGAVTGRDTVALVVRLWGGLTCKVGTGFSHDEAEAWVARPSSIIGQTIEVTYMGVHEGGVLREPRYAGIRHGTKPDH